MSVKLPPVCHSTGLTHVGKKRKVNEDSFLDKRRALLWAVADGMGGHQAGDRASQLIVRELERLEPALDISDYCQLVSDCLNGVNRELSAEGGKFDPPRVIGSTVVVLIVSGDRGALLWAGDSRGYRLRQDDLEMLTKDHSQIQEMIDQGMVDITQAHCHPSANVITRAVGGSYLLELDTLVFEVRAGDRFLLCSDGLYRDVTDFEIETILKRTDSSPIAAEQLIGKALAGEARDNISLVVVDF